MWQQLIDFIYRDPIRFELIESTLIIVAIFFIRAVLLHIHFYRHPQLPIEDKRRWVVVSRNGTLILGMIALIGIWAAQLQTLALSMFAVAAAIAIATKEIIMCILGSFLRASTKQYSVGDYIEINGFRGRVVDINILNTLMMQVGPNSRVDQLSGSSISFPNSLLLSHTVQRDNIFGLFVIHTFDIPVPIHLNANIIITQLQQLLDKLCAPYIDTITKHLEKVQTQKLFITPAVQPRIIAVPHNEKIYFIIIRFAAPVTKRLEIQQSILDEFIHIQHQLLNNNSISEKSIN